MTKIERVLTSVAQKQSCSVMLEISQEGKMGDENAA
jgi:hypothetical protein